MTDYFKYGDKEITHLKRADKRLAAVIREYINEERAEAHQDSND